MFNPDEFYTFLEIANKLKCHRTTVSRAVRKLNIAVVAGFGDPRVRGVHLLSMIEAMEAASLAQTEPRRAVEMPTRRPVGRPRKQSLSASAGTGSR